MGVGNGQVSKAVAFLGIIDILQPYSATKQMETHMKSKPRDARDFSYSAISAVPAGPYAYVLHAMSHMTTCNNLLAPAPKYVEAGTWLLLPHLLHGSCEASEL